MADDKHFVMGDHFKICARTGFKIRAGHARKEWTNSIVRDQSFEMRHPQDFVTGIRDDQTVPEPRPRQVSSFQGPLGTVLTTDTLAGDSVINVDQSIRMFVGDVINVMLDNGENFHTTIFDVMSPTRIQTRSPLPYRATSGNVLINITAESDPVLYQG